MGCPSITRWDCYLEIQNWEPPLQEWGQGSGVERNWGEEIEGEFPAESYTNEVPPPRRRAGL